MEHDVDRLSQTLAGWWDAIKSLTANSSEADWRAMTDYLAPDCIVYFGGMAAPASEGPEAVAGDLRKVLSYWRIIERRVVAESADASGTTIFVSMNNRLAILGEEIDYPETEVVKFDDNGKIAHYELYCDPAPIKAVFARKAKG